MRRITKNQKKTPLSLCAAFVLVGSTAAGCAADVGDSFEDEIELGTTTQPVIATNNVRVGFRRHDAANHNDWRLFDFVDTAVTPALVLGGPSANGGAPLTVRAKDVTTSSFSSKLHEWYYLDGPHVEEGYEYILATPGLHTLIPRFGTINANLAAGRILDVDHRVTHVSFPNGAFRFTPLVFATQVSDNGDWPTVVRVTNVTTTGFDVYLQEEISGNPNTNHLPETINYVAMPSQGLFFFPDHDGDGRCVEVFVDTATATHQWKDSGILAGTIASVVGMQTDNGWHPAAARKNLASCTLPSCRGCTRPDCGSTSIHIKADEEGSNGERTHAEETFGIASFSEHHCLQGVP